MSPLRLILSWLAPHVEYGIGYAAASRLMLVAPSVVNMRVTDGAAFKHEVGRSFGDHRESTAVESVDAAVDGSGNRQR